MIIIIINIIIFIINIIIFIIKIKMSDIIFFEEARLHALCEVCAALFSQMAHVQWRQQHWLFQATPCISTSSCSNVTGCLVFLFRISRP